MDMSKLGTFRGKEYIGDIPPSREPCSKEEVCPHTLKQRCVL
ncbi:MAG: hypothetical protein HPY66_0388 [Firmicutes bacterium]|nr:hypothetical protein [Bacillota bacterium]